jgi:hypothetical protein
MYDSSPAGRAGPMQSTVLEPLTRTIFPRAAAADNVAVSSPSIAPVNAWSQRTRSLLGVQIVSTGSYVPDQIVTNDQLQDLYGCDSGWIEQRTGILRRRYAAEQQATSDLCIEAARRRNDGGESPSAVRSSRSRSRKDPAVGRW